MALALRAIGCADVRSGIRLRSEPATRVPLQSPPTKTRKPPDGRLRVFGGGGGNRTRVRRRSAPGATCL